MKVKELIDLLEDMDPDAEVLLAQQPGYPFEYSLRGVVERSETEDGDDEAPRRNDGRRSDGTSPNDVLLVEGSQLRYGSKAPWGVV